MIKTSLKHFLEITGGIAEKLDDNMEFELFATIDSRTANSKTFFAAFIGENVDGHEFVAAAITNGAPFALTSKSVPYPHVRVPDVAKALISLAKFNRKNLPNMTVIGITGSSGKTTTKDLLAHLLTISGNTVAPAESLNNELGVPLLLLKCNSETKYCVVEMGARHKGDIAFLAEIAVPNIGVVLGVGSAHLGEFGSIEAIAETKSELIVGLPENGTAILGTYDLFTEKMAAGLNLKVIKFGEKNECDVRAADIEFREGRATFDLVTPLGRSAVSLQLLGLHQIPNALAAAAVGFAVGLSTESISAALSTAENKSKWRMELEELSETLLINDCYNANPESVIAALRTLALLTQERGGSSWAILGKMHELGESSASEHARVGKIAHDIEIDHLLAVGEPTYLSDIESGETMAVSLLSKDQVGEYIQHFQPGDVVLVKASRAEKFETIVDEIRKVLKERSAL